MERNRRSFLAWRSPLRTAPISADVVPLSVPGFAARCKFKTGAFSASTACSTLVDATGLRIQRGKFLETEAGEISLVCVLYGVKHKAQMMFI